MDTRLNKTCSLYTACRYNKILSISVFVIPNDIEFSLYHPINILPTNVENRLTYMLQKRVPIKSYFSMCHVSTEI